jgi:hypothetical protein
VEVKTSPQFHALCKANPSSKTHTEETLSKYQAAFFAHTFIRKAKELTIPPQQAI